MLVTKRNFDQALKILARPALGCLGFDTETYCLNWWDTPWFDAVGVKPGVFSMQFATDKEEFYFDFHHSDDKLGASHFLKINAELTQNPDIVWFIHNAKFDLHHSANHGVEFAGHVHCTKAIARVVNNLEPALNLDDLGERYLKSGKLDVISTIKERGHVTKVKKFGHNDKEEEILHFDRLELAELVAYGKRDTRMCYDLGRFQVNEILRMDREIFEKQPPTSSGRSIRLFNVLKNEYALTKVCYKMEREGVLIDRAYTEEAYEHEVSEYRNLEKELNAISTKFIGAAMDWLSPKKLKVLFDAMGEPYGYTEKGNACFDRDALEASTAEVAKLILRYRYHYKRAHTYFENFIWLADRNNVLHADAQQAGTETGRMSYWTPNLQNIPKRRDKDEAKYKVRRCFIPKPGGFFADFDYTAAEYAMMLDYAKEMPLVEKVKNGEDVHEATRVELNLKTRDEAKTMNFGLLYGMGYAKFAKDLKCSIQEAKAKKNTYFQRLPNVTKFIYSVRDLAGSRGYIFNWLGRLLTYERDTAFKAPNGLIQGGVGDMAKVAMVEIDRDVLPSHDSKMLLPVHDAILFWIKFGEEHLVPKIEEKMRSAYPHRVLPMKTDAGFSAKAWSDLQDEIPPVA